jgi:hypothetical protein
MFLRRFFLPARLFALGMSEGNPLDTTEETFDDLLERVEGTVKSLGGQIETLAGHLTNFVKELATLKPASAVAEVSAAVKDEAQGAVEMVGEAAEGAGHAAAVPVAALEDAGKDAAKGVEKAPAAILRRKGLKRHRRG